MEECRKLGVMDFEQSQDSPNEYKNNFFSLESSDQESGYESSQQTSQSFSSWSCDPDSLSLEEQSLTTCEKPVTCNNHDVSFPESSYSISNSIEHCNSGTLLLQPSKSVNKIEFPEKEIIKEQVEEYNGQEAFCHGLPSTDIADIIEEKAISIDETKMPDGFDHVDSSRPKVPTQIVSQETHDSAKIRCSCKTTPALKVSELKRRGMETDRWLRLETRTHGHFISDCSLEIQQRFKLNIGDRLLSVNEEDLHNLRHDVIIEKINDVIHMETRQTLVIERHSHTDDDGNCFDFCRYEIQLECLEEDGGNTLINVSSRLLVKLVRRFSVIYNLECDGKQKCWISHYTNRTDKYLCPRRDKQNALALGYLPSIEDPKFQFSWCQYHGFRKNGNENVELFLLTLMSKDTDGYICVGTKGNVRLKTHDYETEKMTSIANPLPYMFICRRYQDGTYNLESLNHEGWFLRWNEEENTMDIQQRNKTRYQPDFMFNIYTDPSKVRQPIRQ